ncbi:MAG: DNA-directed RNA polymerase subunit alpha, partial [Acidimicrobiia bacterium]
MLIVQRPQIEEEVISDVRSKIVVEPLEPGFGYT